MFIFYFLTIKITKMANYKIEEIEGIGPVMGDKLREAGINNTDKLLEGSRTKKQRADLADSTGISEKLILRFANMADLFRITGVGQEFAELLEAAGVDTVPELAQRNAENLTAKMEEVNNEKQLTRRTPSLKEVEKWVAEAKELPRALEY
jgi:predicted flap endonuclease-1-like 5' DNA nuclease